MEHSSNNTPRVQDLNYELARGFSEAISQKANSVVFLIDIISATNKPENMLADIESSSSLNNSED